MLDTLKKHLFTILSFVFLTVACDQFGLDLDIPISTTFPKEIELTEDGDFSVSDEGSFFSDDEEANILGNVKNLNIDSITYQIKNLVADSISDSIPYIDGSLEFSLDTLVFTETINGSLLSYTNSDAQKLSSLTPERLSAIADLLTDKANNNVNPTWEYIFQGSVKGAPLKCTISIGFYGRVKGFPTDAI